MVDEELVVEIKLAPAHRGQSKRMRSTFLGRKESFQAEGEGFLVYIGNRILKPAILDAGRDIGVSRLAGKLGPVEQAEVESAASVSCG